MSLVGVTTELASEWRLTFGIDDIIGEIAEGLATRLSKSDVT